MKKILMVEDSPVDAAIISDIIGKNGFEIQVAKNAKEGFEKAVTMKPDLILLDLILPDESGFELCKRLRATIGKSVLIVVVSIRNELSDINKAFDCGADDYVIKPPSPELLLRKVRLYLQVR